MCGPLHGSRSLTFRVFIHLASPNELHTGQCRSAPDISVIIKHHATKAHEVSRNLNLALRTSVKVLLSCNQIIAITFKWHTHIRIPLRSIQRSSRWELTWKEENRHIRMTEGETSAAQFPPGVSTCLARLSGTLSYHATQWCIPTYVHNRTFCIFHEFNLFSSR
jgi:hypothetical protein